MPRPVVDMKPDEAAAISLVDCHGGEPRGLDDKAEIVRRLPLVREHAPKRSGGAVHRRSVVLVRPRIAKIQRLVGKFPQRLDC